MKTHVNTDFLALNQLHQAAYDSVFDHVWIPVEILTEQKFQTEEQINDYFSEHEDYCGVRTIDGKYQVSFPIYRLDYMVGLDVAVKHIVFDDF